MPHQIHLHMKQPSRSTAECSDNYTSCSSADLKRKNIFRLIKDINFTQIHIQSYPMKALLVTRGVFLLLEIRKAEKISPYIKAWEIKDYSLASNSSSLKVLVTVLSFFIWSIQCIKRLTLLME